MPHSGVTRKGSLKISSIPLEYIFGGLVDRWYNEYPEYTKLAGVLRQYEETDSKPGS